MPRVVHFDIPVDDPQRASRFYSEVFGWKINKWEGGPMDYWLATTGDGEPGINGGLTPRSEMYKGTVNTIDVASIDDAISAIEQHGGKVAAPKMHIPGVGHFATCLDTERNVFGILQVDRAAS
ncbi:MAG TPA: VOC family protein [Terriglobales bacterium]